tara:strand:- start:641 stop:1012 length:372 start_codon:yes stop_codon:yes gene_type:complete
MKPVTKSVTKGVINGFISSIELIQGIIIGLLVNKLYFFIKKKREDEGKPKRKSGPLFIIMYVFILMSVGFIARELNQLMFKKIITKNMQYDLFLWPPPIMFGFGLLFFQDELKDEIRILLNNQ